MANESVMNDPECFLAQEIAKKGANFQHECHGGCRFDSGDMNIAFDLCTDRPNWDDACADLGLFFRLAMNQIEGFRFCLSWTFSASLKNTTYVRALIAFPDDSIAYMSFVLFLRGECSHFSHGEYARAILVALCSEECVDETEYPC